MKFLLIIFFLENSLKTYFIWRVYVCLVQLKTGKGFQITHILHTYNHIYIVSEKPSLVGTIFFYFLLSFLVNLNSNFSTFF